MPNVRFAPGAEGSQSFVSEGGGWFSITLLLSQPSALPVTVVVRPFASGVDGADMDLGDVTITFPPGETSAVYRAQIYDDTIDEVDENVFFEIVSASEATIDLSSTDAYRILGRILDNDLPPGPTVRFAAGAQGSQSFASEGAGSFTITLTLSHASSVPVSVVMRPFPGAVDGADMDLRDVTVTLAPGEPAPLSRPSCSPRAVRDVVPGFSESNVHQALAADLVARVSAPMTRNQAVAALYHSFAGGPPDVAGLVYWAELLKSGVMALRRASFHFAQSAGFQKRISGISSFKPVNTMYLTGCSIEAAPAGRSFNV